MNPQVKSAVRVLDLLEILSTAERGLTLVEISTLLEAPKSSALMLLRTLVDRAYAERDEFDRYRINPALKFNEIGWIGGAMALLVRQALPVMRKLTDNLRETSILATLTSDGHVRLLTKIVSQRDIRYDADLTRLHPAHRTASGRVQLAYMPPERIESHIAAWSGGDIPERLRVDGERLRRDLEVVREAGVALNIDQWVAGATGVAAPVFNREGRVVAAVTVAAVTARFIGDQDEIVEATKDAASALSREHAGHHCEASRKK
ncbi:helix-turn-helix domain-containing protein [Rhizobiales bacterium]|uniref:IclR family transcriptional regulator n=1 Tax=Hongsoonwoonella zoysiae TaxID=2821844 RepID=UPI0015618064|nr:IclR family transcriptional regulator C-terminal domain-containing protein [Hongsoonwoonella zoysiae]NRG17231.1 helix-turn-helix domain-containing protein [Hongsoonwoonella zoysiae]